MGRKFLEKRPNSAFSCSSVTKRAKSDMRRLQRLRQVSLCEFHHVRTGGAALIDEDAQGVAGGEPQVGPLVDGGAEDAGDAFKGRQQVHGTRAEAREHGPNLGEGGTCALFRHGVAVATAKRGSPRWRVELPAAVTSRRLWPQASVPLAPVLQLRTDTGGTVTTTH